MLANNFSDFFKDSFDAFSSNEKVTAAKDWLNKNSEKLESMLKHAKVRDFIFEPIRDVFSVPGEGEERRAREIITQVAVVNAIIAGLPGSLGMGVVVSIALELWMAYSISKVLGLGLSRDDAIKTVVAWAASAGLVLVGFKAALNVAFPIVTALMPIAGFGTAVTQLVVTNLFGVIFWIMFEELRDNRVFRSPMVSASRLTTELKGLLTHQASFARQLFNLDNLKTMGVRFKAWISGEVDTNIPKVRGDLAAAAAMVMLINREESHFEGPLGREFIQAIRDRYPDLENASIPEISEHMSGYTEEQMVGVINLIKGKLFERMVAHYENEDSDEWKAVLHEDEQYPGSDLILFNEETGDTVEVSLKATDSLGYLERSLTKYPDYAIVSTDEVAAAFGDSSVVMSSGIANEEVTQVTRENFEVLLKDVGEINAVGVAAGGTGASLLVTLWPFVIARLRNRIDNEQLEMVCMKVLPETGKMLASRLSYAIVFGPVFAWWLLARSVLLLTKVEDYSDQGGRRMLLELKQ